MTTQKRRKPTHFKLDDPAIVKEIEELEQAESQSLEKEADELRNELPAPEIEPASASKGFQSKLMPWGLLLFTSILGLLGLSLIAAISNTLTAMIARADWLAVLAICLIALAILSAAIMVLQDIIALSQLSKLSSLAEKGRHIHSDNALKDARKYVNSINELYEYRSELAWQTARLKEHKKTIMDGAEVIELVDSELGAKLDEQASNVITATARKVSLITAIAPGPFIDMAAVAVLNIRMIRSISEVYGVRPGFFGIIKLIRKVLTHLALSGGIAVTGDLLRPLIGSSIAGKISRRLGEGIFNGGLTIRIGLSATEIARPIPYVSIKRPSFTRLATSALNLTIKKSA